MNSVILDEDFKNNEDIKKALLAAGLENHYELEDGLINIEESSTVQVEVKNSPEGLETRMKFPQVGNTIQIIFTVVLIGVFSLLHFQHSLIAAVLGGQIISFGFHYPRIKRLQEKVNQALKKRVV